MRESHDDARSHSMFRQILLTHSSLPWAFLHVKQLSHK